MIKWCLLSEGVFFTRAEIGISAGHDILEYIARLPEPEKEDAFAKIRAIETAAMPKQTPQPGLVELMDYVDSKGLPKALCTRNFKYVHLGDDPPLVQGTAIHFVPIVPLTTAYIACLWITCCRPFSPITISRPS